MFLFKKIVAPLLFPLPLAMGIMLVGLILLWFTRRQRAGKILATAGFTLLALMSCLPLANRILAPLESRYDPLLKVGELPPGTDIVVLGGGHVTDPNLTATDQLSESTLFRLVEGISLHRTIPRGMLVLSGGGEPVTEAEAMAKVALELGVRPEEMILDPESRDTKDQARQIKNIVGEEPFVLVTSASHIHRAMLLFQGQGLNPIPAPTNHVVRGDEGLHIREVYPSPDALGRAERAIYEILGVAWARLRGQAGEGD